MNIFRVLGDLVHLSSKGILISAIHRNRSAEGVSLITQILYAVVFCTRYLDIFKERSIWNLCFKIMYIGTSFYILAAMQWVFPRTRERELSWKLGSIILGGSMALSPFVMMIFEKYWGFLPWMWVFSQILEAFCVLPQLLLLRQTTVPTVIDSYYLVALGSYRVLYFLNWIVRELDISGRKPDPVAIIFGIIQIALYVDFAWVYYTRQRVKLRGGGVVDADDMRRGVFVGRIFGRHGNADDEDEEQTTGLHGDGQGHGGSRPRWGARGISVSADDGTNAAEGRSAGDVDPDAKMQDPDDLAKVLDDDDDDEDTPLRPGQSSNNTSGVRNDEWRD